MIFDQLEKFGDDGFFAVADFTDGAHMDFVAAPAHTAGNGHHLLQMIGHEIAAVVRGAALLLRPSHHVGIGRVGRQAIQQADAVGIGNGFDIEGENRSHDGAALRVGMAWILARSGGFAKAGL